jgi:Na+/H+ antiporter NhaC
MNVLLVLTIGLISAGVLGALVLPDYSLTRYLDDMWQGFLSMIEITLLSILVGGLANLMREQGGLSWLLRQIRSLSRHRQDSRTGEIGIASLSALSNLFIANNTVSILISGSVAKELAQTHQVSPARSASLLDIFACVVQGLLPYGAQILLAASLAGIPPLLVAGKVFYCWVLAGAALLAIALGKPKS